MQQTPQLISLPMRGLSTKIMLLPRLQMLACANWNNKSPIRLLYHLVSQHPDPDQAWTQIRAQLNKVVGRRMGPNPRHGLIHVESNAHRLVNPSIHKDVSLIPLS